MNDMNDNNINNQEQLDSQDNLVPSNNQSTTNVVEESLKDGNTEIFESEKLLTASGSNYFSELLDSNSTTIDKILKE